MASTALHSASEKGHIEIVKLLLENGANVIAKDESGQKTALELVENKINESSDDDSMSIDSYDNMSDDDSKVSKEEYEDIKKLLEKHRKLEVGLSLAEKGIPFGPRNRILGYLPPNSGGKRKSKRKTRKSTRKKRKN